MANCEVLEVMSNLRPASSNDSSKQIVAITTNAAAADSPRPDNLTASTLTPLEPLKEAATVGDLIEQRKQQQLQSIVESTSPKSIDATGGQNVTAPLLVTFTNDDAQQQQPAANKNRKRFFRKKVKTIVPEMRPKPDDVHDPQRPLKTPFRFKPGTLIRNYPTWPEKRQQEATGNYAMRRRSDGTATEPRMDDEPAKNAWWTKYLRESPSSAVSMSTPPMMSYFGPDYVHNPVTLLEQQNSLFKSPEVGTMNPYTGFLGFILNRVASPLLGGKQEREKMLQEHQHHHQQQQQQANLASKLRNLYGRNRIPIKQMPAKKFLSKLASPYTYYAYQNVQDNFQSLATPDRLRPNLGEVIVDSHTIDGNNGFRDNNRLAYNATGEEDNNAAGECDLLRETNNLKFKQVLTIERELL